MVQMQVEQVEQVEHWPLAETVGWEAQERRGRQASMRLEDQSPMGYLQPVDVVEPLVERSHAVSPDQLPSLELHELGNDLGNVLGVGGLIHEFPILPRFCHRHPVKVDALVRSCLRSSVMNTTDAISPVGIKYVSLPDANFRIQ